MLNKIKDYLKVIAWPIIFTIGQVFILVAMFIILNLIDSKIDFTKFINENSYIVSIINLIIFIPIFIKVYKKYKSNYQEKPRNIIKLIMIGISLSLFLNIIIYLIEPIKKINLNIFYILNIALVGPILEEYLFRGIVYNKLLEFNNEKDSYFISVIIFALMHMGGVLNIIYAFIMGLILTKIYINQKTLKSSMLFHIIINTTSSLIFPLIISVI